MLLLKRNEVLTDVFGSGELKFQQLMGIPLHHHCLVVDILLGEFSEQERQVVVGLSF